MSADPPGTLNVTSEVQALYDIINAIEKRRRTLVLTGQGKRTLFMNKFFPSLADKFDFKIIVFFELAGFILIV